MKYFIIYEVVKNEGGEIVDIVNKYDSTSTNDIANWLDIDKKNISHYTAQNIDNINCKLKENKYFILKDID